MSVADLIFFLNNIRNKPRRFFSFFNTENSTPAMAWIDSDWLSNLGNDVPKMIFSLAVESQNGEAYTLMKGEKTNLGPNNKSRCPIPTLNTGLNNSLDWKAILSLMEEVARKTEYPAPMVK